MEYSLIFVAKLPTSHYRCLNPYSNGILSDLSAVLILKKAMLVLILILMEYSLISGIRSPISRHTVLILILMEYSLIADPLATAHRSQS